MREVFQFVENKGKFFVRMTEILNKIYNILTLKIIGITKFKNFFKKILKNLPEIVSQFFEQYVKHPKF